MLAPLRAQQLIVHRKLHAQREVTAGIALAGQPEVVPVVVRHGERRPFPTPQAAGGGGNRGGVGGSRAVCIRFGVGGRPENIVSDGCVVKCAQDTEDSLCETPSL